MSAYNIILYYNILYHIDIMQKYDRDFYGNVTVDGVTYTNPFLRDNIPFIIEYNINTHNYFFVSRTGLYVGHNTTNINDILPNLIQTDYKRIYLFNDICPPWNNQQYMEMFITRFNEETANLGSAIVGDYKNPFAFIQYSVADT